MRTSPQPGWRWWRHRPPRHGASLTGLKSKIGDIDGSVWLLSAAAEYMIVRNFGVGVAFLHTGVDVEVTKPRFNGVVEWKSDNLLIYGLARF